MTTRVEPALARRLEALTGEDASCCVDDLKALAGEVAGSSGFQRSLARVKALADENRYLALAMLQRRDAMCGCELQAALGLTHATVSHHMTVLLDAGLVASEKRGKWVYYRLSDTATALLP